MTTEHWRRLGDPVIAEGEQSHTYTLRLRNVGTGEEIVISFTQAKGGKAHAVIGAFRALDQMLSRGVATAEQRKAKNAEADSLAQFWKDLGKK